MASGDSVVHIIETSPAGQDWATFDIRLGGSTPTENIPVWDFDASAIEYLDFLCRLKGYGGNGLTFTLVWMASSAVANECRWGIAIRAFPDDAEDVDTSHTYDYNEVDATCASETGEVQYTDITFTNGADMDSWVDGELAIVRVRRNATHVNDDMAGDAELLGLFGKET